MKNDKRKGGTMKKILWLTAVIIALTGGFAHAAPYFLYGKVFTAAGTTGTAETENSYCGLAAFRAGISGEIGIQNSGPDPAYPEKIYPAYYDNITTPAYAYTDVGSSDWTTAPAAGQIVTAVYEVYAPRFEWDGSTYIACTKTTISDSDISGSETDFSDISLELLPAPGIAEEGVDYIKTEWTGIDMGLVTGYTLYRSDDGTEYSPVTVLAQDRGNLIQYTDDDPLLSSGTTYYYKISANIEWGGGSGALEYYETNAKSPESSGAGLIEPSPTATNTLTITVTPFDTPVMTETLTYTITPTLTITPTYTMTCTPTPTATEEYSPMLLSAVEKEKVVVFNNPVRNSMFMAGFEAEEPGSADIYIYNIKGELVQTFFLNAEEGNNIIEKELRKAPGIYVVRVVVNKRNLPLKKLVIIK